MAQSQPNQLPKIEELLSDDPERVGQLTIEEAGIYFDFSKTHLTEGRIADFQRQSEEAGLAEWTEKLFSGEIVNPTEERAAEHVAERGNGNADAVQLARRLQQRMRALIDVIEAGGFDEIEHILHIGIGGSALGPKLLIDALGRDGARYDVKVVSNIDGAALAEATKDMDPAKTLLVMASKSFTTTETLMNAESAIAWMREGGVEDPYAHTIALTANPQKAVDWGIDETRILPFSETVGGRYSLWCSVGFPAAAGLGWAAYEEMLEGAAVMDRHFRNTPIEMNAPVLAAFVDRLYIEQGSETRAVFAYDERLRLLPDYLQQLEMESNGKSAKVDGSAVDGSTAAITWGGVGTDAQHAVFQLLHQGTHLIPVEFIASITPGHDLAEDHHQALLQNCFAQGAALMKGDASEDRARNYPGNRPSTTLLLDDVTPSVLGALIAFYEHRTFVNAVLTGINPFDQFGVELGKKMAREMEGDDQDFDPSTRALLERAMA